MKTERLVTLFSILSTFFIIYWISAQFFIELILWCYNVNIQSHLNTRLAIPSYFGKFAFISSKFPWKCMCCILFVFRETITKKRCYEGNARYLCSASENEASFCTTSKKRTDCFSLIVFQISRLCSWRVNCFAFYSQYLLTNCVMCIEARI